MQQAFKGLKDKLVTAPVYPNFERPVLETNASHDGLGAVLVQQHTNGTTWPIAYARCTYIFLGELIEGLRQSGVAINKIFFTKNYFLWL